VLGCRRPISATGRTTDLFQLIELQRLLWIIG
jgi:hypothetical protein